MSFISQRLFSDAFRDMQRAMAVFDHPFFNTTRRSLLGSPSILISSSPSRSAGYSHFFGSHYYPPTDMVETADSYELSAELPGFDKKNIKIELADDQTLVLSGSVNNEQHQESKSTVTTIEEEVKENNEKVDNKKETEQTAAATTTDRASSPQWWVKERVVTGSFSRSFDFPTPIQADTIKASFENGILKVTIPKPTQQDQAKQEIHIE
ncbi:HSP20-like chaperone [Cokeromyces recurvatus]|uniref:HSP20-like chaperone n=1 Tax=Cokeromyces recurvatus TaxID=90255 RepID=UPI0022206E89|nr:HSP20-like chaperone [Cokeromyces recurvatus]KAI7901392.1 HSP20-like chaperone [Cokeromyces recurvatus]